MHLKQKSVEHSNTLLTNSGTPPTGHEHQVPCQWKRCLYSGITDTPFCRFRGGLSRFTLHRNMSFSIPVVPMISMNSLIKPRLWRWLAVFCDAVLSSLVEIDRRFKGTYCLRVWNVSQFLRDYTAQHPRRHLHTRRRENLKSLFK
jgi:hypothetical protein